MELATIFRLLVSKIWILIIIPVVAAAAGYLFTLSASKKYKSTALLTTGFTTNENVQIADERVDLWVASVKFDNMIEKMNSEAVMSMLTYQLMVHDLSSNKPFRTLEKKDNYLVGKSQQEREVIVNIFKEKLQKMEVLSSYDSTEKRLMELTEDYQYAGWILKKKLNISRARSTDFVEVVFVSEDPLLSAFVVNTLSEEYIRYDSSLKTGISGESVKFFSDLVDEKKKILDEKTIYFDKYKSSNNLYGADFTELKSTQIVDYELLRQEKLDEIRSKTLSIADVDDQLNNFDGANSTSGSSSETNTTILQIKSKINDLNQIYVSGGSKDTELLKTINNLRAQLQTEMNKLVVSVDGTTPRVTKESLTAKKRQLELELEITKTNLVSLDQTIASLKSSVSGTVSKKSTIDALEQEVKTASAEYLQALEKYNTEKNKSLLSSSTIRISQRGQPNGSPESSKTILIVGLSSMASFALCAFVIILIEFLDQRIKNPAKFDAYVDLKLMGWINTISSSNIDLKSLFNSKTADESMERFKHFLRKIRFELENSNSKVLLVTSTKKGEGKTFIILSLAYSLSLLNKRSLIIDTNFRNNSLTQLLIAKPSFQKMLQENNEIKLLTSPVAIDQEHSNNIISKTSDKNIDVIGSNTGSESPSEILAGRNFNMMIEQLRHEYDYIFMEGASLNEFSDTKELMSFADKVITVFSADSVVKDIDKESINYIKNLNGVLMGAILNKVEAKDIA